MSDDDKGVRHGPPKDINELMVPPGTMKKIPTPPEQVIQIGDLMECQEDFALPVLTNHGRIFIRFSLAKSQLQNGMEWRLVPLPDFEAFKQGDT